MIERIETVNEFGRLRPEWNSLLKSSRSDCLFLTWEWLYTWWTHLSGSRKLFLLVARSGNDLVALAPLALTPPRLTRLMPFGSLEFLGTGSVGSDYLDFIIRRSEEPVVLSAMADYLSREKAFLNLSQVNRRSALTLGLAALWKHRGWQFREARTNVCPIICLSGHTWDSYLGTLGPEHRYNFRRKLRQLTSRFDVRFEQARQEEQRREALARLVDLHTLRWRSRGGSDAFYNPAHLAFHEAITQMALQKGWLRLFTLCLDGKPAAALYGFFYKGVFYFYQSGFDPSYAQYSVGLITMGLAIRSAIEEGAEEYDLLHGAEQYKFHWASEVRELSRFELYPSGARGVVCKTLRGLEAELRGVARKMLPNGVAERIAAARTAGWRAVYVARFR